MTEEQREIRRKKRVIEYAEKNGNIKTACRRFGIARSTFYLWRDRYRESGDEGLRRRMCVSHNHPNKTPEEVVEKILHLRRTYHMGPIRIVWYLERYLGIKTSDATVYRVCKRHGLNRLPNRMGRRAVHTQDDFPNLCTTHNDRNDSCSLRAYVGVDPFQIAAEYGAVEKQQGAVRKSLARGTYLLLHGRCVRNATISFAPISSGGRPLWKRTEMIADPLPRRPDPIELTLFRCSLSDRLAEG